MKKNNIEKKIKYKSLSLKLHEKFKGKISISNKIEIKNNNYLNLIYTPGVAFPCLEIFENKKNVYKYTNKGNSVAIVTNGTAVLGLGNIGPEASLPVMEGKSVLFKYFAGIDAFPLALNTKNSDEIISIIKAISPNFAGINLEDIKSPECFYIEKKIKEELNIPIFHDDQHGTAIVVLAGILNSLKIINKKMKNLKITINGAGAAGIAIAKILSYVGVSDILICDTEGIIYKGRKQNMNFIKKEISEITNKKNKKGVLKDALIKSDVFIGVSIGNIVSKNMIKTMNNEAIVFALANPIPEIMPNMALSAGARIVGTGRSDFPNQINNALVFPGIFKGAFKNNISYFDIKTYIFVAKAIASVIKKNELSDNYIIPNIFNKKIVLAISKSFNDK